MLTRPALGRQGFVGARPHRRTSSAPETATGVAAGRWQSTSGAICSSTIGAPGAPLWGPRGDQRWSRAAGGHRAATLAGGQGESDGSEEGGVGIAERLSGWCPRIHHPGDRRGDRGRASFGSVLSVACVTVVLCVAARECPPRCCEVLGYVEMTPSRRKPCRQSSQAATSSRKQTPVRGKRPSKLTEVPLTLARS